ncbi:MAG: hypothetical protein HY646_05685 [Acidobacteria bacterium]|nr:hypothetical protein [Acidobacteriota bacterium]
MNSEQVIQDRWHFHLDLENQGRKEGWFRKEIDLQDWLPVTVPHSFEGPPLNLPGVEGYGWYRLQLEGAPAEPDEHWMLHFGAANYRAEVWVNGKPVGSHDGGYTPFLIEITPALEQAPSQTVVVLVDNLRLKHRCPASVFAWPNVGGIYREVKLIKHCGTRIASVRFHDASTGAGPIKVAADCRVEGGRGSTLTLSLAGPYLHGKPAGKAETRTIELDESGKVSFDLPAENRWHPDHPFLYRAVVKLQQGGRLVEQEEIMTGFRIVGTQGNRFLLNGAPCWVNGMNYLFTFPNRGMLGDLAMLESDLRRIKELGANTIRSHFPMHHRAYELCDQLGLMVWHDIPLYWWHNKDVPWGCSQLPAIESMRPQLPELVDYDYNHPSVVMRIMGNECGFYDQASQDAIRSICAEAKRLDPSRLTTICAYVQQDEGIDLGADAILCNFYREHEDKTIAALPQEVAPTVERLRKVAAFFPDRPIFVSEIGFEGVAHHRGQVYSTEDFQAAAFTEYWRQLTGTGLVAGFAFWCWADYRYIVAKPWGASFRSASPALGCWGLVSEDRTYAKPSSAAVRRCFDTARKSGVRLQPSSCGKIENSTRGET